MQWRRPVLLCLFVGAFLFTLAEHNFLPGRSNLAVAQSTPTPSIVEQYQERVMGITFSTMNPVTESGSVTVPGLGTISWEPGQTPDQFLRLGTFYDSFNLQLFTMQDIAAASGLDLTTLTLGDIAPLETLTLHDLVNAIPGLGRWQVYEIPLIQEMLGQVLNGSGPWDEISLRDLIRQERFGNLALGNLDLGQYGLDSIPGFLQMPLARLPDWEGITINQIPGLNQVPFASFPTAPTGSGYVALFDVAYGKLMCI